MVSIYSKPAGGFSIVLTPAASSSEIGFVSGLSESVPLTAGELSTQPENAIIKTANTDIKAMLFFIKFTLILNPE